VNAPLRRSGMARVLNGSHSFTCTPRVHPLTEWTIPALPSQPKLRNCTSAVVNDWWPRLVRVLGTSHVVTLDDQSRRRPKLIIIMMIVRMNMTMIMMMMICSWLNRHKNYENRLTFYRVKVTQRVSSRSLYVVVNPSVCNVRAPYSAGWNFR